MLLRKPMPMMLYREIYDLYRTVDEKASAEKYGDSVTFMMLFSLNSKRSSCLIRRLQ